MARISLSMLTLIALILLISQVALSQDEVIPSTSIVNNGLGASVHVPTSTDEESEPITFSEFPLGTAVSNQYANKGILFSGDSPFISTDGSNPTSPVLSGTPQFRGDIEGTFVDPTDGKTPVVVESFTLDAGYFDELASTRIEWFDPAGKRLGQRTNTGYGIERFKIEGGNIARWRMSIIKTEPAGYAVDNISFTPVQASVLFREGIEDKKKGTWGFLEDEIPGWDHVGFTIDNLVYESHPGYSSGIYYSEDGKETANIVGTNGVQAQHTKKTFEHDAMSSGATNSPVTAFEQIPVERNLAEKIRDKIKTQISPRAGFQFIDYGSLKSIDATLSPSAQKGGNGTFTCVGLVEWAAEQAGHKNGQGFIRNSFESIPLIDVDVFPPNIEIREFPLLSPQLLNWAMKGSTTWDDIKQWYQGIFDPVDFVITDPLGRQLGYTDFLGEKNEIPNAFYSENGDVEQFLIPNPVAGSYQIEFVGLGKQVMGAMASAAHTEGIYTELAQGEKLTVTFDVEMQIGVPGDVNFDGCINGKDIEAISGKINTFSGDLTDPADIDGNGIIEQPDIDLLNKLTSLNIACLALPDLVVQEVTSTENNIQVVIKNQGAGPVPPEQDFWVDVYINPQTPPTAVNQVWDFVGNEGLVWGVVAPDVPLHPGQTITLTIGDGYYWPTLSKFSGSIPIGTPIYAQVDSANANTPYGGVLESHEMAGDTYNNISGPVLSKGGVEADQGNVRFYLPMIVGGGSISKVKSAEVLSTDNEETLPMRP